MRWLPALTLLLVALSVPAHAGILWRGDFETGDLSQWSSMQSVASDRLQVVDSPVRKGSRSLRVAVRQGDDPINASGNRNELIYQDRFNDGEEAFYRWSTFFPSSYPSSDRWQIFAQFHHTGCCGSPPVEFYVRGEQLNLRVGGSSGTVVWSAPLERVVWQDFILQVRWSADASVGRVALWHQGEQVLAPRAVATRYPGEGSYFKLGLYRDASIAPEAVIFHDDVAIATHLEDLVSPASDPEIPPDDGNPDPEQPDDGNTDEGPGAGEVPGGASPPPPTGGQGPGADVIPVPEMGVSCSATPTTFSAIGLLGAAVVLMRLRRRQRA